MIKQLQQQTIKTVSVSLKILVLLRAVIFAKSCNAYLKRKVSSWV